MAIHYGDRKTSLMGTMTIKQGEKKCKIEIRQGNCFAVFLHICKAEDGKGYIHTLYNFFADEQHLKNIIKNNDRVFFDEVVNIKLNCRYKECLTMLKHIVKYHKVTCYYE
jgi:hypothetical protein